jgi:hypothetical protein
VSRSAIVLTMAAFALAGGAALASPTCQTPVLTPGGGATALEGGPGWLTADNFRVAASGELTSVRVRGAYRRLTPGGYTDAPPPAIETFRVRLRADGGVAALTACGPVLREGLPGAVLVDAVLSPTRAATGELVQDFAPLTLYEWTFALPAAVPATPAACLWLEVQNLDPTGGGSDLGRQWVWAVGGGGDGVSGDIRCLRSPATNPAGTPFLVRDELVQDLAFCTNLPLADIIVLPCPVPAALVACAGAASGGTGVGPALAGVDAGDGGSAGPPFPGEQTRWIHAENLRLAGTGIASVTSVCFSAYALGPGGACGGTIDPTRVVVRYFQPDPADGLPGVEVARFFGGDAGVAVALGEFTLSLTHPPVLLARGACWWVSLGSLDVAGGARLVWGVAPSDGSSGSVSARDFQFARRSAGPDAGGWELVVRPGDPSANLGVVLGTGTVITPTCPTAPGACCVGVGCSLTGPTFCTGPGRRFAGPGTVCNAPGNATTPCCRADFDQDGQRRPADVFAYASAYFDAGTLLQSIDIDRDGVRTPSDLFLFLSTYFAGGC